MSDVDVRVNMLKERVKNAEKIRLMREHTQAIAESDFERAQEVLREEFGVSNPEEAKALLQDMETELEAVLEQIDEELAKFEAQP